MGGQLSRDDPGDHALRFVGTVELWKNIVMSSLVGLVTLVAIVLLVRYHAGWQHGEFEVKASQCGAPQSKTRCDSHGNCSAYTLTSCTMHVDGFDEAFTAGYDSPAKPPAVGARVKVFYDPADKSKAFLAHNDFVDDFKIWLILGLALICLGAFFTAWFQYHVRDSHMAQRVEAGAALFRMAT